VIIPNKDVELESFSPNESQKSALYSQDETGLMNSVFSSEEESIEDGELLTEAFNQNIGAFVPDDIFKNLVENYSFAKKLYGETFLREITGQDSDSLSRNVKIPEFQRELLKSIEKNINKLKEDKLLTKEGIISPHGVDLAAFVLYKEELDSLISKGLYTDAALEEINSYGHRAGFKEYKKGDRYKDINLRKSLKVALRRGHEGVETRDLRVDYRKSKEQISVIYAIDVSSSMKGDKLSLCKKAGVALAFKAIQNKDKVGLIVFGSEVHEEVPPSRDFMSLLREITQLKASGQTNITETLHKAVVLLDGEKNKHLVMLTDALPTKGKKPEEEVLEAVSVVRSNKITISVIGLGLDKKGEKLAEEMIQIGGGRLYNVREFDNLDKIVLEEYHLLKED